MKKKGLLGILAVLMVFALALTGCRQKGEQNTGATGFGDGNGTSVSEPKKESVVDEEPTVDIGEKPDGSNVIELMHWYQDRDAAYIKTVEKDSDGYYHYKVGDKELLSKLTSGISSMQKRGSAALTMSGVLKIWLSQSDFTPQTSRRLTIWEQESTRNSPVWILR